MNLYILTKIHELRPCVRIELYDFLEHNFLLNMGLYYSVKDTMLLGCIPQLFNVLNYTKHYYPLNLYGTQRVSGAKSFSWC